MHIGTQLLLWSGLLRDLTLDIRGEITSAASQGPGPVSGQGTQSPPFGGKCEHHPVAGRGGWETCWSGHLWKNIVAERVLGQGNSEEVAPLVFFFAERPVNG